MNLLLSPPLVARRERRRTTRLPLRWPVTAHREGRTESLPIRGATRDISSRGLLFETQQPDLQPGDILDFRLELPAEDGVWPTPAAMTGRAQILRVNVGRTRPFEVAARFLDQLRFDL